MNKKTIITISIVLGFIIAFFYIASSFIPQKTNWKKDFGIHNKSPFGFYVLYKELKTISNAKSSNEIISLDQIRELDPTKDVIFYLNEDNYYQDNIYDSIQIFINKGGSAFLAETSNQQNPLKNIDSKGTITQSINHFSFNSNYNKFTNSANHFTKTDKNDALAYVSVLGKKYANYIKVKEEKGFYYEHADPILFTNLYLLSPDGYQYTKEVFKPFYGKNIYWINPSKSYANNENSSPLSYILSQPELRNAWYLLLICMFLYLIFKSKREQKIIPIILPEQNLSLDFANVIASMYYESGKPNDIIKKKIDYFFYTLRKQFNIATDNVNDEYFIFIIAQKAQISNEEALQLITQLQALYQHKNATLKDVTKTYQIINDYKKKAQII